MYPGGRCVNYTAWEDIHIYIYICSPPPVPTFWVSLSDVGHRSLVYQKFYLKHVISKACLWVLGNGNFYAQKLLILSLQKACSIYYIDLWEKSLYMKKLCTKLYSKSCFV